MDSEKSQSRWTKIRGDYFNLHCDNLPYYRIRMSNIRLYTYEDSMRKSRKNATDCIKKIYGTETSYCEAWAISKLVRLSDRRDEITKKFALKTAENPRYSHWFPLQAEQPHELLKQRKYLEDRSHTERRRKGPILTMRRILNNGMTWATYFYALTRCFWIFVCLFWSIFLRISNLNRPRGMPLDIYCLDA